MKRISVFVVLAIVLCFGLVNAQTTVSLDNVVGLFSPGVIKTGGSDIIFNIRATNLGSDHYNPANGFRVYSPDGATWRPLAKAANSVSWGSNLDLQFAQSFINPFGATGSDADTVGFGGVSFDPTKGLPAGWDAISFILNIGPIDHPQAGKHICIDSSFFPPGGTWKWAALTPGGDVLPGWDGPHCFELYEVPDLPPDAHGPANYSFSHCSVGSIQFTATDVDGCFGEPDVYQYYIVSGPGSINAVTGLWTWSGPTVPQTGTPTLVVGVRDLACGADGGATATVELTVTNAGPVFTAGCGASVTVQTTDTKSIVFAATDDCDPKTYAVINVIPAINGTYGFVGSTLSFTPADGDDVLAPGFITMTVEVSDGDLTATCDVFWKALGSAPYQVSLIPDYPAECGAIQGQYIDVDVVLDGVDPNEGIGGFNFLIAYDNSALSFQSASEGDIYALCNWEYFEYRYGADGNCTGGCPSGLLRVVGIAETNNGAAHPTCGPADPVDPTSLATLTFLITNDRTLECQFVPIRFFWLECGDNTISNLAGTQLYVNAKIYEFGNPNPINAESVFPSYLGANEGCMAGDKVVPIRNIDFYNGGIQICCAEEIDARGDINLNGLAYEIADAVMFTNYFVKGLVAFQYPNGSIAASDVNADGIALSVADLVYLVRVVVGDALPYPKTNPVAVNYTTDGGVLAVDGEMGAAFVVASGNQTPTLLVDGIEMEFAFDGANTRIIVIGMDAGDAFSGAFLNVDDVISVEFATYEGTPVAAKNVRRHSHWHRTIRTRSTRQPISLSTCRSLPIGP
jgi:hypothetical protein